MAVVFWGGPSLRVLSFLFVLIPTVNWVSSVGQLVAADAAAVASLPACLSAVLAFFYLIVVSLFFCQAAKFSEKQKKWSTETHMYTHAGVGRHTAEKAIG